jgi:hypothetical protein
LGEGGVCQQLDQTLSDRHGVIRRHEKATLALLYDFSDGVDGSAYHR